MNIVVFPGQGSQKIGMARDLYNNYNLVKNLFKIAEDISELPLCKIIFDGQEKDLKSTIVAQISIMLVSIATLKVLEEVIEDKIENFAALVAGHSLGEYSALVASQVLSFEDAVSLLKIRGQAMEQSYPHGGAMLAVIGIENMDILKEVIRKTVPNGGVCEIANDNSNGQVILSGTKETLEIAAKICKEDYKAKITKFLEVSGPFHSSLMGKAVPILEEALSKVKFNPIKIPYISNVTAKIVEDSTLIKPLLLKQIISPVKWRESIMYASNLGVKCLIEVGPNKVLTGLAKRIDNKLKCVNIESVEDISAFSTS